MTRIVAGVFDDERSATTAARELRGAGFEAADLDQFALNPPGRHNALPLGGDEDADPKAEGGDRGAVKGAAIGSAVGAVAGLAATPLVGPIAVAGGAAAGAYAGSLAGAVRKMGDERPAPQPRPAGVMVAVNADVAADEARAIEVLRTQGARMIERADGTWRNGKWADFDPVHPPDIVDAPRRQRGRACGASARWRHAMKMSLHTPRERTMNTSPRTSRERSVGMVPALRRRQEGRWGYVLAWLIGVPVPILILIYLLRGCT